MKKGEIIEKILLVVVILSVVIIPFAVRWIDKAYFSFHFPKGSQVWTLYGIADEGIWTQEPVNSFNYWWKKFERMDEIPMRDDGKAKFFRLTSSDVLHSFAIPFYRIGPYDVKPGEFKEVEFKTDKPLRSTRFLCYQYCDKDHEKMFGKIVISPQDEE